MSTEPTDVASDGQETISLAPAGSSSLQLAALNDDTSSEEEELKPLSVFDLIKTGFQTAATRRIRRGIKSDPASVESVDINTGWTYLQTAAYYGAERTCNALIKLGATVHVSHPRTHETALHLACKWPHEKTVEVLLKAGANPNALNMRGRSPGHTAALFCRRGALEAIIHAGGDISLQDFEGNTPLHLAARNGGPSGHDVIRLLLKCKCRLDIQNKAGEVPLARMATPQLQALLIYAASEGLPDLIHALVKRGGIKLDVFDSSGMSPLQTAAFKGDVEVARALLAAGAKPNFQATASWAPCPSLSAADGPGPHTSNGNTKPLGDRSPLHFAAERGAVQIMEMLIAAGAKVNNSSNEGLISPLHIAVWNQQPEAVRLLLQHKADVKSRVNKNGMAPLHFACNARNASITIISALLDAKADIEERCSDGLTPLMLAAQMAPADAVRLLLVREARVQAKGRRGMTAIDCAEGRHDILTVFAQHCAARGLTELAAKANTAAQRAARFLAKNPQLALPSPDAHGNASGGADPSAPGGRNSLVAASALVDANASPISWLKNLKQQVAAKAQAQFGPLAGPLGLPGPAAGALTAGGNSSKGGPLQQLMESIGLPSSLSDIGSSPLVTATGNGPTPNTGDVGAGGDASSMNNAMQMFNALQAMMSMNGGSSSSQDKAVANAGTTPAATARGARSGKPGTKSAALKTSNHNHSASSQDATTKTAITATSNPKSGSKTSASTRSDKKTADGQETTALGTEEESDAKPEPKPPQPIATCTCYQPKLLVRSLRGHTCNIKDGGLFVCEHQLQMTCTEGCKFWFHLPCWKAVKDQLKMLHPDLPGNFNQWKEAPTCFTKECGGNLQQVLMLGPAGTQTLFSKPPPGKTSATTTIKAELVIRPSPLSSVSPLQPMSVVQQYTFVTDKPASPPPAPAPVLLPPVILPPPAENGSFTLGPAPASCQPQRVDSPSASSHTTLLTPNLVLEPPPAMTLPSAQPITLAPPPPPPGPAADAHLMRRKRRQHPREAAEPEGPPSVQQAF